MENELTAIDKLILSQSLPNQDDVDLIMELSKGLLDRSPKKNWVESAGGLPGPIEDLAVELHKKGMSISRAIATAVSKAKVYAVTADGAKKAKWAAAVAEWNKMRAASKAKTAAKSLGSKS